MSVKMISCRNVPWMILNKVCGFFADPKSKMATTAGHSLTLDPMGNTFKNLLLRNYNVNENGPFYVLLYVRPKDLQTSRSTSVRRTNLIKIEPDRWSAICRWSGAVSSTMPKLSRFKETQLLFIKRHVWIEVSGTVKGGSPLGRMSSEVWKIFVTSDLNE